MATFKINTYKAEGKDYGGPTGRTVCLILDFQTPPFPPRTIEADSVAAALAALATYAAEAEAAAVFEGKQVACSIRLAAGRAPNGWRKVRQSETTRYCNVTYPEPAPIAPAPAPAPFVAPPPKEAPKPYAVGDILESSWGYDQTNYDFYEVMAVRGASIVVRMLEQDSTPSPHNYMVGTCTPKPGCYKAGEDEHTKRPSSPGASFKMESWGRWVRHWDGTTKNWTAYA